jgi:excisionase family DNA binding protein
MGADLWTVSDVAKYLEVGASTVTSWASRGRMPAPDQYVGRTPVWTPQTIIQWAKTRPRKSTDASDA